MSKVLKTKSLIFFLLLFLFLGAIFVFSPLEISIPNGVNSLEMSFLKASAQRPLEIIYPEIPGTTVPTTTKTTLPDYIRYIFQFSLFLGALIAFGSFFYGGVRYITSAGNSSKMKDAQSQITSGILGLLILSGAYILLNTINPDLVFLKVSLPTGTPSGRLTVNPCGPQPSALVEIPLGGVIENLWGERTIAYPGGLKLTQCYKFDPVTGDRTTFENQNRLDCIKWLSESIKVKAENLKKPIEELQKLYDCQNCCKNCCKDETESVCNWIKCSDVCRWDEVAQSWKDCSSEICSCAGTNKEGCLGNCGSYSCCEGQGLVRRYQYQECPYSCCEFFEDCSCNKCGFGCKDIKEGEGEDCNCICVKEDKETGRPVCCNADDDPDKPYKDILVRALVDKDLLEIGEEDPYPEINDIKTALKELIIKIGFSPLTSALLNNTPVCCPPANSVCSQDEKIGVIDCLLRDSGTKDLIKEILIGDSLEDETKLKEILKIKSVMTYLVEGDLLSTEKNLAKTMMRELDLLKSEVALNEIAWTGTMASPSDEWIELYNNTAENIDLSNWKLVVKNKFEIELSGTILAQGFFLLTKEGAISEPDADLTFSGDLSDKGGVLELYDEFGNVMESLDCSGGWFGGNNPSKASMERINPQVCVNDKENWSTNWSIQVKEEQKENYINGKDREGNPIYGTPKSANSIGTGVASYSFDSLVAELRSKLQEESQREKLILVLRNEENLERMLKTEESKEALEDILVGDDFRLKLLLNQWEVLKILLENKENFLLLLGNEHVEATIKNLLNLKDEEWQELIGEDLSESITNLKLINDFQRDLVWVSDAGNLMRNCEQDPISYDQFRIPETSFGETKIEEVPEWENVKKEVDWAEGADPSIFYCSKSSW